VANNPYDPDLTAIESVREAGLAVCVSANAHSKRRVATMCRRVMSSRRLAPVCSGPSAISIPFLTTQVPHHERQQER
jgi:hypothetical protein